MLYYRLLLFDCFLDSYNVLLISQFKPFCPSTLCMERCQLSYKLGNIDTLFEVLYPCLTLDSSTCVSQLCHFFKFKKKIQDTVGIREQEESNASSLKSENIHALNNNITFKN